MEHELAPTGGRIDLLLEGAKAHPPRLELPDGVDEMGERAAEPIKPPHHEGVAGSEMGKRLGEARSVRDGPGDRVGVELLTTGSGEVTVQVTAGIQGFPLVSSVRTSKGRRPCLAAVDR